MNSDADEAPTHPRFRERRAEVEDQSIRSRQRRLIGFAVVVVAGFLAAAATQSALLDVDEVHIVGAEQTSPDYVRSVASVELGTPLLGLDTDEIEERLLVLPEVRSVAASSSWSGVVTIEIEERVPIARIESAGGTIVVANDGLVIDIIERAVLTPEVAVDDATGTGLTPDAASEPILEPLPPRIEALPEIAGAMFTTEAGKQIPTVLDDAVIIAAELPEDIAAITERIEITVDSLVLRAVGGGLISLGDARDLDLKFDAIRAFLAQVDLSCLDTMNVRAPSVPVIRRNTNC